MVPQRAQSCGRCDLAAMSSFHLARHRRTGRLTANSSASPSALALEWSRSPSSTPEAARGKSSVQISADGLWTGADRRQGALPPFLPVAADDDERRAPPDEGIAEEREHLAAMLRPVADAVRDPRDVD